MLNLVKRNNHIKPKVEDKIWRHFLFFDFLHKKPNIIVIEIVISIAPRRGCKLQEKRTIKQEYFNFCERNWFSPADKILGHFSIFVIYLRKEDTKDNALVNFLNRFDLSDYFLNFLWEKNLFVHILGLR